MAEALRLARVASRLLKVLLASGDDFHAVFAAFGRAGGV